MCCLNCLCILNYVSFSLWIMSSLFSGYQPIVSYIYYRYFYQFFNCLMNFLLSRSSLLVVRIIKWFIPSPLPPSFLFLSHYHSFLFTCMQVLWRAFPYIKSWRQCPKSSPRIFTTRFFTCIAMVSWGLMSVYGGR